MNLEAVKDIIEASGIAVFGEDLFISRMPAEAKKAMLLRQPFSGTPVDPNIPGFYKEGSFILICRAPEYKEAEAWIKEAVAELHSLTERTIGATTLRYVVPETLPIPFPLSDGALWEFNVRFKCAFDQA